MSTSKEFSVSSMRIHSTSRISPSQACGSTPHRGVLLLQHADQLHIEGISRVLFLRHAEQLVLVVVLHRYVREPTMTEYGPWVTKM